MVGRTPPGPSGGDPLTRLIVTIASRLEETLSRGRREDGQALVEYALILMLVTIVGVTFLDVIGDTVSGMLSRVTDHL
jgi:Flp pilus assembly pilin Flp